MLSEEFTVSGLAVSDLLGRSLLFCSFSAGSSLPFPDRLSPVDGKASCALSTVFSLSEFFPLSSPSSARLFSTGSAGKAAVLLSELSCTSSSPVSPSLCAGELFLGAFNFIFFVCLRPSWGGGTVGLEDCAVVSSVAGALLRSLESGTGCWGGSGGLSSDSAGIAAGESSFTSPERFFGASSPSFPVSGPTASLDRAEESAGPPSTSWEGCALHTPSRPSGLSSSTKSEVLPKSSKTPGFSSISKTPGLSRTQSFDLFSSDTLSAFTTRSKSSSLVICLD